MNRFWLKRILGVAVAFCAAVPCLYSQTYTGVPYAPVLTQPSSTAQAESAGSEIRAGQTSANKPFTISASLREGYNDNINTSKTNKKGSFTTDIGAGVFYRNTMTDGEFSVSYNFGTVYYVDRPQDSWDFQHSLLARFQHSFSPRLSMDVREGFSYDQSPQVASNSALIRRSGNGFTNNFDVSGTYQWTPRFSTTTDYGNTFNGYEDSVLNHTNEYIRHGISQDFSLNVLPTTTAVLSYSYGTYDYAHMDRDYDHHSLSVGADHYLLREWLVSGRFGGEYVVYDNPTLKSQTNPYVSLKTTWNFLPRSSLGASYSLQSNVTDYSNYGSQYGHTLQFNISHQWTRRITTDAALLYSYSEFNHNQELIAGSGNQHEETFSPSVKVGYAVTDYLSFELGYIYAKVKASSGNRDYDQNQIFVGVRGTY